MAVLLNKTAIITGASSGIGYAAAKLFAAEGANVVLASRRQYELEQLAMDISAQGGQARVLAGDVKDELYSKALVDLAVGEFGGLDVAFNNAGTMGELGVPAHETSLKEWNNVLSTNLTSAFLGAKYQLPAMVKRGGGSVIFTSSFVGYTVGIAQKSAYAASKAGMIGYTQALAAEYGASAVRVNALLPGGTDTPMGQEFANTPEIVEYVKGMHALKRMALPEEIAKSALYLASDASGFTTGSALLVDGGLSIYRS